MPGPVERWLETFMCKQYANIFEAFGFKTLQSVCQLQASQLQAMGVAVDHCDKILENVHVLRQTLSLSGTMNYPDEMSGSGPYGPAGNGMPHPAHPSIGYPTSDNNPMAAMSPYAAMQGYRDQVPNPSMMSPPHYPNSANMFRNQQQQQQHILHQQQQQQQQQQQFMNPQFNNMYGNQGFSSIQNPMMMNSMAAGNTMFCRAPTPQSQGTASPSVHPPPHPHLRQGGHPQNPQQVADNILQMASSTYSSSQTVQVPLNKGRSAPYHNPRTNYNMGNVQNTTGISSNMAAMQAGVPPGMGNMSSLMSMQQNMVNMQSQSRQVMQPTGSPSRLPRSSAQFGYPNSSPHPHQPRTSPISPMPIQSPASQHSNQSVHNNPSPGPLQSPVGGSIRSPVSPNVQGSGIQSPCGKQAQMASPTPSQQMRSPMQHMKHMNSPMVNCTPISSPSNQLMSNSMRSPLSQPQHHSPHPQYYSHLQQTSQPQGHYSPASQCMNSPLSHTSSPPYIQTGTRVSPPLSSPHSLVSKPSPSSSTGSSSYINPPPQGVTQKTPGGQFNPLQSLQKLVMLPETQVVDPKSVVNDACLSSPTQETGPEETPKNCDNSSDFVPTQGSVQENKCVDGKHCGNSDTTTVTNSNISEKPGQGSVSNNSCEQNISDGSVCVSLESLEQTTKNLKDTVPDKKCDQQNSACPSTEQTTHQNHIQEPSDSSLKPSGDKKPGIGNKEEQKNKKENMSPKKRFLGSQPMINGNPAKTEKPINSNSEVHLTTNGPTMSKLNTNDKKRTKDSVHSVSKNLENRILVQNTNDVDDSHGYVNKKFFNKRRSPGTHSVGVELVSGGGNDVNSHVSRGGAGVIQSPPHVGGPVYDDVSDASDLEEGELAVRKDNAFTYGRESRDILTKSSPSFSKAISNHSVSSNHCESVKDDLKNDRTKIPFQNPDKSGTKDNSPGKVKMVQKEIISPNINNGSEEMTELQKSQSKHSQIAHSENIKQKDLQHEQDRIDSVFTRHSPKGKNNSSICENSKIKSAHGQSETASVMKKGDQVTSDDSSDEDLSISNDVTPEKTASKGDNQFDESPLSPGEIRLKNCGKSPNKVTKAPELVSASKSHKSENKPTGKKVTDSQRSSTNSNKAGNTLSKSSKERESVSYPTAVDHTRGKLKSPVGRPTGGKTPLRENHNTKIEKPLSKTPQITDNQTPKKRGSKRWKGSITQEMDSAGKISENENVSKGLGDEGLEKTVKKLSLLKGDKIHNSSTDIMLEDVKKVENRVSVSGEKSSKSEDHLEDDVMSLSFTSDIDSTPSSSKKSADASGQPVKKRRGRPPGSKNKVKKDGKHSKRKRDVYEYNSDEERKVRKAAKKSAGAVPSASSPARKRKDIAGANMGPFIRVTGSRNNPEKYVIMNAPQEDLETKPVKKKKSSQPVSTPAALSIQISNLPSEKSLLVPGLSPSDETLWYCCICRKHSSYKFLGDLFGPYYPEGYQPAPQTAEDGSEKPKQRRKKMFVLADQVPNYAALMKPMKGKKPNGDRKLGLSPPFDLAAGAIADSDELWVHEDCVLWSDGVYLIENNMYGLQEAANVAATTSCSSCKEVGASIGCLHKGCSQKYHYVCAVERDCYLDEENFSLLCLKHKEKRTKMTEQSSRKVS